MSDDCINLADGFCCDDQFNCCDCGGMIVGARIAGHATLVTHVLIKRSNQ